VKTRWHFFVLLVVGGVACSSSGDGDAAVPANATLHPSALFSGSDDVYDYAVPVTLANVDPKTRVTWAVADPSIAVAQADAAESRHALVKTKKAGKTTVRATAGDRSFTVTLTVTHYSAGARDLGDELYQEDRGGMAQPGDTAYVKPLGCITCHGARGGPGHSPSEIGGYDDEAIKKTIATGVKPDGSLANKGAHKFSLDPQQQEGILARLRSLPPNDWPK
jgi:mono/diheme cytochrome c family protein